MAAAVLSASACTNLDEEIYSQIPKDDFFTSEEQLVVYTARAYTKLQAWGSEQSLWTLNIQLSDEVAAPRNSGLYTVSSACFSTPCAAILRRVSPGMKHPAS